MKNRSLTFKALGLALCLSATLSAEEFEFHNKTKVRVKTDLGSAKHPPVESRATSVGPDGVVQGPVMSGDKPQFLIMDGDVKYLYQFNTPRGKNIKIKLTAGLLGKKIALEPQLLLPNNIKKEEIVLIGTGSVTETYKPEPRPAPKPEPKPAPKPEPKPSQPTGPATTLATQKVTAYTLLEIPEKASDAQILGIDQATLDAAKLGTATAKSSVKKARTKLFLVWHPDKIDRSGAQDAFKKAGVTDPAEQKRLMEAVFQLIDNTASKYK